MCFGFWGFFFVDWKQELNQISVCMVCFMKILGSASFNGPCLTLIPVWTMLNAIILPTSQVLTQFSLYLASGFYSFKHFYPSHSRKKKRLGIESNFPYWKVVGKERNIVYFSWSHELESKSVRSHLNSFPPFLLVWKFLSRKKYLQASGEAVINWVKRFRPL